MNINTRIDQHKFSGSLFLQVRRMIIVALYSMFSATVAMASVSLTDIGFSSKPGSKFEIRLDFDGQPPEPKSYTIEKPARISMDLPGVSSALDSKKYALPFGNATGVVVLEAGGRTRMIINLVELLPFTTRTENNSLFVEVGNEGAKEYLKKIQEPSLITMSASEPKVDSGLNKVSIDNLDFQRGDEGEGRLVLSLSDPAVDVNVYSEGDTIHVDFSDTTVPEELRHRYDVSDFATPVSRIDVGVSDKGTSLSIHASGVYDYLAYQADDEYVISVKPLNESEVEQRRNEFSYVGDRLSLNFQDIEIRAVLQLIADFTELNLVASDTVDGRITLRLQNVPWDQALELVLKTKGLDKRQVGNVLMVAPAAEIAERERQEIESNKQISELAPMKTEFIRVRYATAVNLLAMLNGGEEAQDGSGILSARGSAIVDSRTNALLITDTAANLIEARKVINLLDVPIRQVMIEARIVIARSDISEQLGIAWGGGFLETVDGGNGIVTGSGNLQNVTAMQNQAIAGEAVSVDFPGALLVDLGVGASTSSFAIGYASNELLLNAELSALEASGLSEIVSQPKVITGDKENAIIKSGTEVPYQEASASGETTTSFKEAVLALDVTPNITPDDRIMLQLKINQDSIGGLVAGENGAQIPTIDTTELSTNVLVKNGETIVLGGVFRSEDVESTDKVPFFGDLPYVGALFSRHSLSKNKNELLIFITPRILADTLID